MDAMGRLIELIDEAEYERMKYEMAQKFYPFGEYKRRSEFVADYLLANGVIVLPCKVGDYIYYPWHYDGNSGVAILEVNKIVINGETLVFILDPESDMPMPCWFSMDDFGKTVFLTKEEAIAALKEKEAKRDDVD